MFREIKKQHPFVKLQRLRENFLAIIPKNSLMGRDFGKKFSSLCFPSATYLQETKDTKRSH